jgi:hypothetical protein
MTMTLQRYERDKDGDQGCQSSGPIEKVLIERDSPNEVTLYGPEKDGVQYVLILTQDTIDQIKKI